MEFQNLTVITPPT